MIEVSFVHQKSCIGLENLNGVAQKFGGGGHKFACGAKIQGNINETISIVTSETKDSILNQRQLNLWKFS